MFMVALSMYWINFSNSEYANRSSMTTPVDVCSVSLCDTLLGLWERKIEIVNFRINIRLDLATGDRRAGGFLCQRISYSLAIQRGNVACLLYFVE